MANRNETVHRDAAGKFIDLPAACQKCGNAWLPPIGGDVYCLDCGHLGALEPDAPVTPEQPAEPTRLATPKQKILELWTAVFIETNDLAVNHRGLSLAL